MEAALLEAAWAEVQAVGYRHLTMEGVAARAHTSKAVLYRRWPNRARLVHAAMRRHVPRIADNVPDTGSLRQDVLTVLGHLRLQFETLGPDIVTGLVGEAGDLADDMFDVVPDVVGVVLARAVARGEARADRVTRQVQTVPGNLLRHELLLRRRPVSDAFLAALVDEVFLPLVERA